MNRYAAQGITRDAEGGKHVIVITINQRETSAALDELATCSAEAQVTRSRGHERIAYPTGGAVTICSYRQGLRGLSADVLYLDDRVRDTISPEALNEMLPALATSTHHELIIA
jgi:hypothetical protein